ncbi:nuclear transport factor 2 family protein [Streptomyces griseiscabiei]|uniref:Nuclear transport factor 2 family protein n=1 Tax=Streptomyces griseiscabiei TaxID=2993540 RepID=A0ABU4LGK1_9ACTN|nr:nuclear transport factor 2 family protein [Streptomyces griseiscabiei]MBZ3900407.1 nuclear transport factor 2 family protein [Streptomyces griseiscabiei]MDX2914575.1 nuclear transport factor 2 family protein [Streptomyces griseiscabiei]
MTLANSPSPVPADPAKQLQWLVDRAAVTELIAAYSRSLDARDWEAFHGLMTEDATFAINGHVISDGRKQFVSGAQENFGRYHATWHNEGLAGIRVDGDDARSRAYHIGIHVTDPADINHHGDAGGWYENTYRRTPDGWRIASVDLALVWTTAHDANELPVEPTAVPDPTANGEA